MSPVCENCTHWQNGECELAEEEMAETACRLFEQFMSGVFQGDTPKKMAQEFKQKLME